MILDPITETNTVVDTEDSSKRVALARYTEKYRKRKLKQKRIVVCGSSRPMHASRNFWRRCVYRATCIAMCTDLNPASSCSSHLPPLQVPRVHERFAERPRPRRVSARLFPRRSYLRCRHATLNERRREISLAACDFTAYRATLKLLPRGNVKAPFRRAGFLLCKTRHEPPPPLTRFFTSPRRLYCASQLISGEYLRRG